MNFQNVTTSNTFSLGSVAKFLARHQLSPPPIRQASAAIALLHPDEPEVQISFPYAIATMRSHLDKEIAIRNAHPRKDIELISKITDLTVTTQSVSTSTAQYSNRLGFPVRNGDDAIAMRSYAADALSAAFTSPSKTSGEFAPNFVQPVSGLPRLTSPTAVASPWTGNALENAEDTFTKLDTRSSTMVTMSIVAQTMQSDANTRAFTRTVALPMATNQSTVVDGKHMLPILKPGDPKYISSSLTLDQAYVYMVANRSVRGTDKDHISPLTSGYYWMSCTRPINSAFCDTLVFMDSLVRLQKSAIFFDTKPDMALMNSLVANQIVVFYRSEQRVRREYLDFAATADKGVTIVPGIYPLSDESLIDKLQYVRVFMFATSPPIVSKKDGVKYAKLEDLAYINETMMTSNRPSLAQVYAAPGHYDQKGLYVYPSVRAHSGHILLSNVELPGATLITADKTASRIANANLCKTWFPFTRSAFNKIDKSRYGIIFAPLHAHTGFKIRMTDRVRKTMSIDFTLDGEGEGQDPVDDESMRIPEELIRQYAEKYGSEMLPPTVIPKLHVPLQDVRHLPAPPALLTQVSHQLSAAVLPDPQTYMSSSTTTTAPLVTPVLKPEYDVTTLLDELTFDVDNIL